MNQDNLYKIDEKTVFININKDGSNEKWIPIEEIFHRLFLNVVNKDETIRNLIEVYKDRYPDKKILWKISSI